MTSEESSFLASVAAEEVVPLAEAEVVWGRAEGARECATVIFCSESIAQRVKLIKCVAPEEIRTRMMDE